MRYVTELENNWKESNIYYPNILIQSVLPVFVITYGDDQIPVDGNEAIQSDTGRVE